MIYIFEDGRILYDEILLTAEDEGRCLEFETIPEIEPKDGKVGVITGCDVAKGEVIIEYSDIPPEPEPISPIPPQPTEQEILQAEMLLNQQQIISKQAEQDTVLAELLLNQQGVDR